MTEGTVSTAIEQTKALIPWTAGAVEKAKAMTVDDFKTHFLTQTDHDLAAQKESAAMTQAGVQYMTASRGLGKAIDEILTENDTLQKKWGEVIADLAKGEEGSQGGFMRKLASSSIPIASGWAKGQIEKGIESNILEILPDLLRQQLDITEKASDRVQIQITILTASKKETENSFLELGEKKNLLRAQAMEAREVFDKCRGRLAEIDAQLKENEDLDNLLAEGKSLPEGKKPLSEAEYGELIKERSELIPQDGANEIALQKATQELKAVNDGYKMTEIQIGQMNTTLKAMSAIGTMLEAFLKVTKPIMMKSIIIINSQASGTRGAALLNALGQTMNETLKICSLGMTVMTQQAMTLGSQEFLKTATVEEVKAIQATNDTTWRDFTRTQYDLVMKRIQPILEHPELAGETPVAISK